MEQTMVVESMETVDSAHETSVSVAVTSERVAQGSPATLRVELRNESGVEREYTVGDGTRVVFGQVESETRDPGLALVTREEAVENGISLDALPGDCRLETLPFYGRLVLRAIVLDSGEASTIDLDVYGHPENDDTALPSGTFRFQETYGYRGFHNAEDQGQFDWGFSVKIQ